MDQPRSAPGPRHDGWKALPLWLRPLGRLLRLLEVVGLAPSVEKMAAGSLADRQKGKPARWACLPVQGDVHTTDVQVPTRDGSVCVRTYRPAQARGDVPVVLYLHGGGWIMGGLDGADALCSRTALSTGAVVVSVDYRLAPEHPFPAGLHDCADVLTWVRSGSLHGGDVRRIAVSGDSAGGNLAAALTLLDRDASPPLMAQVLMYPGLDLTMDSPFLRGFRGPGLTWEQCRQLVELYLGPAGDRTDPLASPLHAASLEGLPPALVLTGGADILLDDGRRYVERLLTDGTEARLVHYARAPHAFLGFDRLLPEARDAHEQIAGFLRVHLQQDEAAQR